jgi:hypothetical protein
MDRVSIASATCYHESLSTDSVRAQQPSSTSRLTSFSAIDARFPRGDIDKDTGRLESGERLSRLVPADSGIDSTPDWRGCGRTGRGYRTARRLLREFIDLTEYEKDTEVVTMLERDSLSEYCRSERGSWGATGQDARWAKTSPIAFRGLDARLIGGERPPEPAELATLV